MNRANILCAMNRVMMQAFSQRTVEGLKSHKLFRLALPPFQTFLDINVDKEVEKNRRIIVRAAMVQQSAGVPDSDHVKSLLHEAREIDQAFVRKSALFPVDIQIRYQDIEQYRQQRIELLLQTSYRILAQWQGVSSFRLAVSQLYNEEQFRSALHEMLRLYSLETRMLSRSVRIPYLFAPAREAAMQTISSVMDREAKILAQSLARQVFRHSPQVGSSR